MISLDVIVNGMVATNGIVVDEAVVSGFVEGVEGANGVAEVALGDCVDKWGGGGYLGNVVVADVSVGSDGGVDKLVRFPWLYNLK